MIRALAYQRKRFPRRARIGEVLGYFRRNRHRMRYAETKARHLPIGSGVVEAACKTLVTERLKRSGMRWRHAGVAGHLDASGLAAKCAIRPRVGVARRDLSTQRVHSGQRHRVSLQSCRVTHQCETYTHSGVANSIGSEHEPTLAIAADSLWHILKDIDTVVRCLPGASLTSPPNADPLSLCMIVAIGPMRARFEGTARIEFDDLRRTATIGGSGHDTRTRSTTHGRIELVLRPSEAAGSILTLRVHYVLKGPLAQFGRGAIVDAVVEQILEQFAATRGTRHRGRRSLEEATALVDGR